MPASVFAGHRNDRRSHVQPAIDNLADLVGHAHKLGVMCGHNDYRMSKPLPEVKENAFLNVLVQANKGFIQQKVVMMAKKQAGNVDATGHATTEEDSAFAQASCQELPWCKEFIESYGIAGLQHFIR